MTVDCRHELAGLDSWSYEGTGYVPAVTFGAWRVAFLNHSEKFAAPSYVERHLLTDESFVLLAGDATLYIGEDPTPVRMNRNRIYNVRQGVWHQIVTTPGARCLVIENANTGLDNSERKDWKR